MNEDDRNEMLRRWINGGNRFQSGGFVPFHVTDESDRYYVKPQRAATPSKDWSKIETYWPHLAAHNTAPQPRRGI